MTKTAHPGRRRRWLLRALALVGGALVPVRRVAQAASSTATIAAMRAAQEREAEVVYRYTEFARKASGEGYRGIAYLFTAFAASEGIHARNFERVLTRLNVQAAPIPKPAIRVGTTRENLIVAVDDEIDSIEAFYPKLLKQLEPEGDEDAMATVRYAWASEQQHRDKIRQIQRWSGAFFERVAKTIDEKTGVYFVCLVCGSTLHAIPAERCPVCKYPSSHYRKIDPPA